ncbi:LysR family transcriptional regulator [uncultured Desulfobacter sp.]|uniref:LysR family transcriptional regulator n=1 Tax=uncultured Desulfobacter sp. TaxID=240139 RepID=UPI002AAAFC8A|nr:LysR family transcriptional regulator [uncultured Desulfobacter sp.]
MDIWGLKIFKTVAEEGSISNAASKLNCAQSNVTARVRQLEDELGVSLFYRRHRGVELTAKGEILIGYAKNAVRLIDNAVRAVGDDDSAKGPLLIGTMESTAAVRLPSLFSEYHQVYPEVDLCIKTGTTEELVKKVLDYKLDGAFVAGPIDHSDIVQHPAFEEELVVITEQKIKSLSKLDRPTFLVFRRGCSYRGVLETWARENGVIPGNVMELGTLEGILGFVNVGMGITLFPYSIVSKLNWKNSVRTHRISKKLGHTSTVFIYRKDRIQTKALKTLIQLLKTPSCASCQYIF